MQRWESMMMKMDDDIDKDEREGLKRGFIVDFDGNRVLF